MATAIPEIDVTESSSGVGILTGQPPAFGHDMLPFFGFEKGFVNLNNGRSGFSNVTCL